VFANALITNGSISNVFTFLIDREDTSFADLNGWKIGAQSTVVQH